MFSPARILESLVTGAKEAVPTAAAAAAAGGAAGYVGPLVHSPDMLTLIAQALLIGFTISGRFGLLRREVKVQSEKVASLEKKIDALSCVKGQPCPTPPPVPLK